MTEKTATTMIGSHLVDDWNVFINLIQLGAGAVIFCGLYLWVNAHRQSGEEYHRRHAQSVWVVTLGAAMTAGALLSRIIVNAQTADLQ